MAWEILLYVFSRLEESTPLRTWLGDQVQQAVESGMSVLISSLTKAAATEIGGRNLPISFDALGTLHSHCYHALGKPEIAEGFPTCR